ncbi:MAG: hypothetical protein KF704_11120 [Crocinitomicaceae bacterium]|nr:hypothetical protein [Crocinitomicaceae bacterium]
MNGAHFHLIVNHFPIILPLVGILILLTGIIARSEVVKRVAYMLFVLGAVTAMMAMASGEEAEEVVESISGISEKYIERHEETAELFAVLTYVLGAVSLVGLWISFKKQSLSGFFAVITLVFAAIVLFFAKQTGTTGGEIRHTEIRPGFVSEDQN